ncbi:Recombination protein RecR [Kiritimatiella glycovorans]|uniref:Recombination protein RecR n=2 Tax=Kiritimatiella glycovorans TaxID=1307763 RepID=A0A0G3EG32_9BACT|nr:Recombination protein RecR [Kiritimatiella glycovorans]
MTLALAQGDRALARRLSQALQQMDEEVVSCARCGHPTTRSQDPCTLCTDPERDPRLLCVVEDPGDIVRLERTGVFHGRYHALMGKLSAGSGTGPGQLRIEPLLKRIAEEGVEEVLLALDTDTESETTAGYLRELLESRGITVTRLARGLPSGSAIEYLDPDTLAGAVRARERFE